MMSRAHFPSGFLLGSRLRPDGHGAAPCVPARSELKRVTELLNMAEVRFDWRGTVLGLPFNIYTGIKDTNCAGMAWGRLTCE